MISTEFAPNESWDDALLSFSLLFQPWRWRKGTELEEVRELLAKMLGEEKKNVYFFLSARAGLNHVVQSLDLPEGSKAHIPGFTCEAVVLPLLANKITPIYNDVTDLDYSSNPNKILEDISRHSKLLLIQHSFGIPPGRSTLIKLAKENDLVVIEDLAHGFEKGEFLKDSVKSVKLLSFGRSKSFSSVFGGAVVTSDERVKKGIEQSFKTIYDVGTEDLVKFINYKWISFLIKSTYNFLGLGRALHRVCIFLNLLAPEITEKEKRGEYDTFLDKAYPNALAILLLHQLKKFKSTTEKRKKAVAIYRQVLKSKIQDDYSLARFPVLVENREKVLKEGREYNVYFGKWYTQPVAPTGLDLDKVMYKRGSCPNAEFICDHIINLPTNVSEETARDIAEIVKPHLLQYSYDSRN